MGEYAKILKWLSFALLLLVLISTAAVSKNDSKDKETPKVTAIVTEVITDEGTNTIENSATEISTEEDTIVSESTDSMDSKENSNKDLGLMPPQSKGEWDAKWFQWATSLPTDNHPLYDTAPADEGQKGRILFLGSTFFPNDATDIERDITVPYGTKIFIPIYNSFNNDLNPNGDGVYEPVDFGTRKETYDVLEPYVEAEMDPENIVIDYVKIDGELVENPEQYVSPTGVFTSGPFPEDNVFGVNVEEGVTSQTVANGYYLALQPLPPGEHTIEFEATHTDPYTGDVWQEHVIYNITVEPNNDKAAGENGNGKNKA